MKTSILIILLSLILQTPAQTIYDVTPGIKGNEIVLSLANISEKLNAENITVQISKSSSNLIFEEKEEIIKQVEAKGENNASFKFDIKREVPVNSKDTIEFLITDDKSIYTTKQFILSYLAPEDYKLEQNFPNPFNPSTTIQYQLPSDSKVTLKIYDILGSEVTTLVNEVQPAGYREIKFDASSLSSGVYIYRLSAESSENFSSIKKMMVLK